MAQNKIKKFTIDNINEINVKAFDEIFCSARFRGEFKIKRSNNQVWLELIYSPNFKVVGNKIQEVGEIQEINDDDSR